jgi:uncharacterized RDD family membrane protein YckC
MKWYYVEQGQQTGPVSDVQLAELVRSGKITANTLVWREGLAEWQPYAQIAGASGDAPPIAAIGTTGEAACAECKNVFPVTEMIRHGNAYICANCKPVFMQKLAEGAPITVAGELNYARVLSRFAALVIDSVLLFFVNFIIGLVAGLTAAQAVGAQSKGFGVLQVVLFGIQLGIGIAYEVGMIGKYGATLGKMALKIKVVTADGGPVSYARAFGRYFAKILSGFTCLIGYIIAIFDKPQRRALHDHICNTRVINK